MVRCIIPSPIVVDGKTLIGEQGNNPQQVQIAATPFPNLKSQICFWQASINANFNLTRLFYASAYTEKPVELWLRPGVYLSHYDAKIVNRETGKTVAPNVNKSLTFGLGGDVAVSLQPLSTLGHRCEQSPHLATRPRHRWCA